MANTIGITPSSPCGECLQMSNGLTAVFIDVPALSGSQLARTDQEKRLIVWLSERGQSAIGLGAVGFDLCEMPWDPQTFEADRAFLLQAVEGAKAGAGWERLEYRPAEELLLPCLDKFAALLSSMQITDIQPEMLDRWLADAAPSDPAVCGFPTCPKHQTLRTIFGCHICGNSTQEKSGRRNDK